MIEITPLEQISETISEAVSEAVGEAITKTIGEAVAKVIGEVVSDAVHDAITAAAGKIADAVAIAGEMHTWFIDNHEDPVHCMPHCNEDGYVYLCGGPYDARTEIEGEFADRLNNFSDDEREMILTAVVDAVEVDGTTEWSKGFPAEPEPDGVKLLHAGDHQWGPGHVHTLSEATNKTLCGLTRERCPGQMRFGDVSEVTCKACLSALARKKENRA